MFIDGKIDDLIISAFRCNSLDWGTTAIRQESNHWGRTSLASWICLLGGSCRILLWRLILLDRLSDRCFYLIKRYINGRYLTEHMLKALKAFWKRGLLTLFSRRRWGRIKEEVSCLKDLSYHILWILYWLSFIRDLVCFTIFEVSISF